MSLFNLGHLTIEHRALAERLFWALCNKLLNIVRELEYVPEELQGLEALLSDTYFCNLSIFQSMPDSWAIKQLFPIMPVHRLDERPTRRAVLGDITCDSDGKIDQFIDLRDVRNTLELHPYDGQPYYLGAFLLGAYQEILGDLHNLFGDTNAVHVSLDEDGEIDLYAVIKGDTVREVLHYVQYSADELTASMRKDVERAVRIGQDLARRVAADAPLLRVGPGRLHLHGMSSRGSPHLRRFPVPRLTAEDRRGRRRSRRLSGSSLVGWAMPITPRATVTVRLIVGWARPATPKGSVGNAHPTRHETPLPDRPSGGGAGSSRGSGPRASRRPAVACDPRRYPRRGARDMTRRVAGTIPALVLMLLPGPRVALAQGPTVEGSDVNRLQRSTSLGPLPGSGGSRGNAPADIESYLGGRPGPSAPHVPSSISRPGPRPSDAPRIPITVPPPKPPVEQPAYGPLVLPDEAEGVEEGRRAGGLTLDAALERLVNENLDLRAMAHEIPKARADILTASLRNNPIFYADSQLIPYGGYSKQRSGGPTQYDVNISYPLDVSHKRQARTGVACQARLVLEAQYQDAVREKIGALYNVYVDILGARETVRYARASVDGFTQLLERAGKLQKQGERSRGDVERIKLQLNAARIGLADAEEMLRGARRP